MCFCLYCRGRFGERRVLVVIYFGREFIRSLDNGSRVEGLGVYYFFVVIGVYYLCLVIIVEVYEEGGYKIVIGEGIVVRVRLIFLFYF